MISRFLCFLAREFIISQSCDITKVIRDITAHIYTIKIVRVAMIKIIMKTVVFVVGYGDAIENS